MSNRDIAAATGMTRQRIALSLDYAAVPLEEFEAVLEETKGPAEVKKLARARAGKEVWYERRCPHCGGLLGIEGQS